MDIATIRAAFAATNIHILDPEAPGQFEAPVCWTVDGAAGIIVEADGFTILDRDGVPRTRDGSGRVADVRDAIREVMFVIRRSARNSALATIDANIIAEVNAEIEAVAALGAATSALAIRGLADELVSRQATRARLEAMKTAILHME